MENIQLSQGQAKVLDQILANNSINVLIVGGCRVGKSFLKNYINENINSDIDIKTSQDDIDIKGYDKYYLVVDNPFIK